MEKNIPVMDQEEKRVTVTLEKSDPFIQETELEENLHV